jgi:L,D-transpeptidase YcbB
MIPLSRQYVLIFVTLVSLPAFTACLRQSESAAAYAEDKSAIAAQQLPPFTTEQLRDALETMFTSGSVPSSIVYRDTLLQEYGERGFSPIWIHEDAYPSRIQSILPWLSNAWEHGLKPEWYHVSELRRAIAASMDGSVQREHQPALLARIDLLLSDALLQYSKHMRYGVFNPRAIDAAFYLPARTPSRRDFLEPLKSTNISAYLRNIQPSDPRYTGLQRALREWKAMKRDPRWVRIPSGGIGKLVHGDTSSILPLIAQRLLMTGELTGSYVSPMKMVSVLDDMATKAYALDSTRLHAIGPLVYDSVLVHAVMRYQQRHGLLPDGVIGVRTIARMNRTLDEYIDQIEHTLERFRWVHYPTNGRYVMVNIPAFWLYAVENGQIKTDMAVCTGLPSALSYDPTYARHMRETNQFYARKNYETPQLHGTLSHLILNPVWNVPQSIGSRETYFSALKDPTYLRRKGYRVYLRDSLVDHSTIDWTKYNPRNLPFRFAQAPGNANALGNIKFMFNNDHSIYLHDTPQQWAFNRASRAVSHGCVRIAKPMEFARFLLEGSEQWDVNKVQQMIRSGVHARPVPLADKPPLYIDYYTSWVDSSGVLQFRDDVYRKDALLSRAFASYARTRSRAY